MKQSFLAMKMFPTDNDWHCSVQKDLKFYEINKNEQEIQSMSKFAFKKFLSEKIREKCNQYLKSCQDKHKKTKYLSMNDKMQPYFTSEKFTLEEKQLMFKLRCGMTPNKSSFKNNFKSLVCRLCNEESSTESLDHLLTCRSVADRVSNVSNIKTEDIFGTLDKQLAAVKVWKIIFAILEKEQAQQS